MYVLFQPMISGDIQSPMGVANVEFVDPREPVAVSSNKRSNIFPCHN
jgi:hypothetical protein